MPAKEKPKLLRSPGERLRSLGERLRRRAASPASSATQSTEVQSFGQGDAEQGLKASSIIATELYAPSSPSAANAQAAASPTKARVTDDHQLAAVSQAPAPATPVESPPKPAMTESTEPPVPPLPASQRLPNAAYNRLETEDVELVGSAATSRTGDPAYPGSSEGRVPVERRASEQAKATVEDASYSSLVAPSMHRTSEPLAQVRTDDFLVPCDAPKRQHSVSFGDNEAFSPNLKNKHCYSRLQPGSIRLLRLMPHKDESSGLRCQLFDYPLESSEGTHLYEALSYVWGDSHQRHSISVDGHDLLVTANLYAALLRLRDRLLERIVWADAICINQDDNEEKGNQIQYMAEIYSKASRVIVWLGEAENDGERALEAICRASDEMSPEALFDDSTKEAILALLQRLWFKRIWVLQEVAAARNVLIKCGSMEIDGYAFSGALNSRSFDLLYEASPGLQSLVHSVTYLVRGAAFRPKKVLKPSGRFSLRIRALGELIEMYCTREAAKRHDKVFALLGMSSDDPIAAGLSPDYRIPWERFMERLVRYLLGEQVAVKTWPEMELAVIRSKGFILGQISSTTYADRNDRQQVAVTLKDASGNLGPKKGWTLPPSAESVEIGDLICLLRGAANPMIIRPLKDHFSVIMIAAPPLQPEQPTINVLHDFLFVWDWEKSRGNPRDRKKYKLRMESRMPEHSDRDMGGHSDGMTGWNMALILEDGGKYKEAEKELGEIIGGYESQFGEEDLRTLTARDRLALIYSKTGQWEEAKKLVEQVIQTRMQVQGTDHPDTANSRVTLASTYRGRGDLGAGKLEMITSILERKEGNLPMIEYEVVKIAELFDEEVMKLLLDQRGDEVKITKGVVTAVAGNRRSGLGLMKLLLDRRGDKVKITEGAVVQIAKSFDEEVMKLLLDRKGDKVKITEDVVTVVAGNRRSGEALIKLLLDRKGDEVKITEGVVTAAARNERSGEALIKLLLDRKGDEVKITEGAVVQISKSFDEEVMKLLLDRKGDEVKITEGVVTAVAGHEWSGEALMELLLDRKGDEVKITEGVVTAAAGNRRSGEVLMKLLLDRRKDKVKITEGAVVQIAKSFDKEVMKLLLDRKGDEVKTTEGVVTAVARNERSGEALMKLLLDRKGDEVKITEGVVTAAARNERSGEALMKLLLDRKGDEVKITEGVVTAVAGHEWSGEALMELLLDRKGDEVKITEGVATAAARNERSGEALMKLLLDRKGDEVKITEGVATAAARNEWRGEALIKFLLDRKGDEVKITEGAVVQIAKSFNEEVMKLLLDRKGDEVKITEDVVTAAARNERNGEALMKLLLDRKEDEVKITEGVVTAAARNERSGEALMKLLLDRKGDEVKITESVVTASVGNELS